jgi:hypothetical protein
MNFGYKFDKLDRQLIAVASEVDILKAEFAKAKKFTGEFLDSCAASGITKVAIGVSHKSIKSSTVHPFGAGGSVFAFQPKKVRDKTTWPPTWRVVERMGISGGCGNSDQHQLSADGRDSLIDGVYHLKSGAWMKIEE